MNTFLMRITNRLFPCLLFKIDESIDLALEPRKKSLLLDLNFIGGLSEVGVVSVELLIGESDGTWFCFALNVFGGDDGVSVRDFVAWSLSYIMRTAYSSAERNTTRNEANKETKLREHKNTRNGKC